MTSRQRVFLGLLALLAVDGSRAVRAAAPAADPPPAEVLAPALMRAAHDRLGSSWLSLMAAASPPLPDPLVPVGSLNWRNGQILPVPHNTPEELAALQALRYTAHDATAGWALKSLDPVPEYDPERLKTPDQITRADHINLYHSNLIFFLRLDSEENFRADVDAFKSFMREHLSFRAAVGLLPPFTEPHPSDPTRPMIWAASTVEITPDTRVKPLAPDQWIQGSSNWLDAAPLRGVTVGNDTIDGNSVKSYTIGTDRYSWYVHGVECLVQREPNADMNILDSDEVPVIQANRWKNGPDPSGYRLTPPVKPVPHPVENGVDDSAARPDDFDSFNATTWNNVKGSGKYLTVAGPKDTWLDLETLSTWSVDIALDPASPRAIEGFELGHNLPDSKTTWEKWYDSLMHILIKTDVTIYKNGVPERRVVLFGSQVRYIENMMVGVPKTLAEARSRRDENGVVGQRPPGDEELRPFNNASIQRSPWARNPKRLLLGPQDRPDGLAAQAGYPDPALGEQLFQNLDSIAPNQTFSMCWIIDDIPALHYKRLKPGETFDGFVTRNGGAVTREVVAKFLEWGPHWQHIVYFPPWKAPDGATRGPFVGNGDPAADQLAMVESRYGAQRKVYPGATEVWGDLFTPIAFPPEMNRVIDAILGAGRGGNALRGSDAHPAGAAYKYAGYLEHDQHNKAGPEHRKVLAFKTMMKKDTVSKIVPPHSFPMSPSMPGVEGEFEGEAQGIRYYASLGTKLTNSANPEDSEQHESFTPEGFEKTRNPKFYAIASASCCGQVVVAGTTVASAADSRPDVVTTFTREGGEKFTTGFSGGPATGTGASIYGEHKFAFSLNSRTTNFKDYEVGGEPTNLANDQNQAELLDGTVDDPLVNPKDASGNSILSNRNVMPVVKGERISIETCAISGPGISTTQDSAGNKALAFYIKDMSLRISRRDTGEIEKEAQLVSSYQQEPCGMLEFIPRLAGEYVVEVIVTDRSDNTRTVRTLLEVADSEMDVQRLGTEYKKLD